MPSPKRRPGRPSIRTPETAEAICNGLMGCKSLYRVLARPGMPSYAAVCRWLAEDAAFREQYAHAREFQDVMLTGRAFDAYGTARFSTLKSRMGRLRPKKHGWW